MDLGIPIVYDSWSDDNNCLFPFAVVWDIHMKLAAAEIDSQSLTTRMTVTRYAQMIPHNSVAFSELFGVQFSKP